MISKSDISDEQLNAFIDDQLDAIERAQVIEATRQDRNLAAKVNELREIKELTNLAYRQPPMPDFGGLTTNKRMSQYFPKAAAAGVILFLGITAGWLGQGLLSSNSDKYFTTVANFDTENENVTRVLLHVSTLDEERINAALETTERYLKNYQNSSHKVQLEVIANAGGLAMLRQGSPFTSRIKEIVEKYDNASFLACGVAMENAKLKEGSAVTLIPTAQKIPAALERILTRVENGWMYIRG